MADKNGAMENLFKAIDIITAERLSNLGYDKTIKATIIDDSQSAHGRYTLTDGSSTFEAFCDIDTRYKKDMIVYVIIPESNWDNDKLIVGKYSNKGDDYYNYANPSDDFLDVTHNLISEVNAQSLLANAQNKPYVRVWSCDGVEYKGYNRLALKGNFRTWLSSLDVMKGTYGLVLYVVSKESLYDVGDFERTYKFNLLTSDMYGDPFNFETYYLQEKVFDISNISNIVHMELLLVQNSDFYNNDNELIAYKDENGNVFPDNIFVQQPYISLGYDLNDTKEDEVRLYTLDSETYDATYNQENIKKTMEVRWVHLQEDGIPVAIDKKEEIPSNSVIRWYKYILDRAVTDKMAGALWQEIEEARNTFSYSFVPDILVSGEKFKVIVESPSREAIIAQLKESEFGDFTGIEIKDKEGQTLLDSEVLLNALNSYNDNSLLSFQEYKQIILEYNAKYQVEHQRDYPNFTKAITILDNIQRAQSDICIYKSEVLEFKNESYDPVAAAIDLISGLTILVDPAGYNGSYLLYNDSGMITNAAEATRKRALTATYQSLITGEQILDKAERIVWYFPIEGSMIYPPQLGTEYSEYEIYSELTSEEIATLELPCKYCRIERAMPEVLEGDAGSEVMRQTEQIFRIKDYYTQTATNNTVYCSVFKNGRQYDAEASLVFGVSGTCGTDATFILQMREWDEKNKKPSDHPVSALTIGKSVGIVPKFYDYNNNDITDEYLKTHTVNYSWYSQDKSGEGAVNLASGKTHPKWAKLTIDSGADISKCQYYILSATVSWSIVKYEKDEFGRTVLDENGKPVVDTSKQDIEARDVQLKTFLPIPVRADDKYTQVVGPTQIIYNKDGTNPTYYDAPFVLYENGKETTASWMMACQEYLDSGEDTASRDSRILNYYPALDASGKMTPKSIFLSDGKPFAIEAIVNKQVIWTQPILIIKNKYASAMLNSWDGELCIDPENGTIMSTMVGAGIKDVNNTFTGVLMGDVAAGAGFDSKNHKGIGIYGFHQSDQSFGFNSDGTAFIGKSGRGRIVMDGNKGTIQSGTYDHYSAGMQIDLDGDDSYSASLFAYGSGGAFELNTDGKRPLLEIRSTPDKDGKILFYIGKISNNDTGRNFYLQSETYEPGEDGTKIDLKTGKVEIFNRGKNQEGAPSYIRIDGDGTPYFQIHDGPSGKDIFYAGTDKYQLISTNYVKGSQGVYLDLKGGSIEARTGIIGGWHLGANSLTASDRGGNIVLNSNGSILGGTTWQWSILQDGTASFKNLTVSETGSIGPFLISPDGLSYNGGVSFTLDKYGLNLNSVFTVDRDGNVLIAGDLIVSGDAHLRGSLTVEAGGIFSNGADGFYKFESSSANIGPWTINSLGISTDYSFLGAEGSLSLKNNEGNGFSVDPGATQIKYGDNGLMVREKEAKIVMGDNVVSVSENRSALIFGQSYFEVTKDHIQARWSDIKHSMTINGDFSQFRNGSSWIEAVDGKEVQMFFDQANGHGFHADANVVKMVTEGTSLALTKDDMQIDNHICKKDQYVKIGRIFSTKTALRFHKGLLITDLSSLAGEDNTEDTEDLYFDHNLEVNGNLVIRGTIQAYKSDKEKTLAALGKLAFVDDITKKFNVTASGSIGMYVTNGTSTYFDDYDVIYHKDAEGNIYDVTVTTSSVNVTKYKWVEKTVTLKGTSSAVTFGPSSGAVIDTIALSVTDCSVATS